MYSRTALEARSLRSGCQWWWGGGCALSEGSRKDLGVPAVLLRGGLRLPARVTGLARGDRQWLGLLAWSGRIVRTSWGKLLRSQR